MEAYRVMVRLVALAFYFTLGRPFHRKRYPHRQLMILHQQRIELRVVVVGDVSPCAIGEENVGEEEQHKA